MGGGRPPYGRWREPSYAGCGALCPSYDRGCYGCYGPAKGPNVLSLGRQLQGMGVPADAIDRLLHTFNAWAPEFREGASQRVGLKAVSG